MSNWFRWRNNIFNADEIVSVTKVDRGIKFRFKSGSEVEWNVRTTSVTAELNQIHQKITGTWVEDDPLSSQNMPPPTTEE